jgi:hypothetical protein
MRRSLLSSSPSSTTWCSSDRLCKATRAIGGDSDDRCPNADDAEDSDADGIPDGCDVCPETDDAIDTDGDGRPDECDQCLAGDDSLGADGDGVADASDT